MNEATQVSLDSQKHAGGFKKNDASQFCLSSPDNNNNNNNNNNINNNNDINN